MHTLGSTNVSVPCVFCNNANKATFLPSIAQYGQECHCGDFFGLYGEADNCDMPCAGGVDGEVCGGLYANSIYQVYTGIFCTRFEIKLGIKLTRSNTEKNL